ncbi:MAG: hypothetical protein FJY99_00665 [Candidatus Sericytochromatia bacterium]|nr:hypothetical protein [Candidatus Tanganyikabacteria bacterium]
MMRLARLVAMAIVVVALLGVRNADSVCPRVCLHQSLAHPCSWSAHPDTYLMDVSEAAQAFLTIEVSAMEDATLSPALRADNPLIAERQRVPARACGFLPALATGPPVPPPRLPDA